MLGQDEAAGAVNGPHLGSMFNGISRYGGWRMLFYRSCKLEPQFLPLSEVVPKLHASKTHS